MDEEEAAQILHGDSGIIPTRGLSKMNSELRDYLAKSPKHSQEQTDRRRRFARKRKKR